RAVRAHASRPEVAGAVPEISGQHRRAVRVSGVPYRAARERWHHGREGCKFGHGLSPYGLGGNRKAQPDSLDRGRGWQEELREERRPLPLWLPSVDYGSPPNGGDAQTRNRPRQNDHPPPTAHHPLV